MNIKIEPVDDFISKNTYYGPNNHENRSKIKNEGHSIDERYKERVKQAQIEDDDDHLIKKDFTIGCWNIKKEKDDAIVQNYIKIKSEEPFKKKKIEGGECSHRDVAPDQTSFTNVNSSNNEFSVRTNIIEICEQDIKKENIKNVPEIVKKPDAILLEDFACNVCFEKFKTFQLLKMHGGVHNTEVRQHRRETKPRKPKQIKSPEQKPFICDQCDYKAAQHGHMKTHRMSHTGEKPFKCDVCDFKSAHSGVLKAHKMLHTGDKPFKCDQCIFKSAISSHLTTHKMKHTGEKPYKCDQCNFKSAQSSNLKKHRMSHTGEKPFKCDQCDFKAARLFHLKTHKLSHTGEMPFECDKCNYKSVYASVLKRHKVKHVEEK